MKTKHFGFLFVLISTLLLKSAFAGIIEYQPSPFNGRDIWITSYYSYASNGGNYGLDNGDITVGGWGDWYNGAIKFDLEGLPNTPTNVEMWLMPHTYLNSTSQRVGMKFYVLTNSWNTSSGWYNTSWTGMLLGTAPAPVVDLWNPYGITTTYNQWKSGSRVNQGFMLAPTGNNNQFNYFYASNHTVPWQRPKLVITYNDAAYPTPPNFKLPLPSGHAWVVTTEVGGLDDQRWMTTDPYHIDIAHTGLNYFSIDLGGSNTWTGGDIPILAAAAGKVVIVGKNADNGNYIVIDHDSDGSLNTGYSTRYLHLKDGVFVMQGSPVIQGQVLGYMGNTGASENIHLHFGVRYADQGYSTTSALQIVKIEGLHMKQHQTEVTPETRNNANYLNRARSLNSYFMSTNTPYYASSLP